MKKIFLKFLAIILMISGLQVNQIKGDAGSDTSALLTPIGITLGATVAAVLIAKAITASIKIIINMRNTYLKQADFIDAISKNLDKIDPNKILTKNQKKAFTNAMLENKGNLEKALTLPDDLKVAGLNEFIGNLAESITNKLKAAGLTLDIKDVRAQVLNTVKTQKEFGLDETNVVDLTYRIDNPTDIRSEIKVDQAKLAGYNKAMDERGIIKKTTGTPAEKSKVLESQIKELQTLQKQDPGLDEHITPAIQDLHDQYVAITKKPLLVSKHALTIQQLARDQKLSINDAFQQYKNQGNFNSAPDPKFAELSVKGEFGILSPSFYGTNRPPNWSTEYTEYHPAYEPLIK